MGVTKQIIKEGNGTTVPWEGAKVTMHYTGWLYDESKPDNKGSEFDSSVKRGPFQTQIGKGQVIKGWDQGILGTKGPDGRYTGGMSLGEKATLVISSDFAYGDRGFPGLIPAGSSLMFEVELLRID